MAGYSGTPLAKKLGIKEGARLRLVRAPVDFAKTLAPLPDGVAISHQGRSKADVIVFFTARSAELGRRLPGLVRLLTPAGGLWIAWPKKSSGLPTDLSFDVVQTAGLATGLVDNKICAVDETWSGLRFVIRVKDRPSSRTKQATGRTKKIERTTKKPTGRQ